MLLRDGLILFCVLLVQPYLSCGILNRRPNDHIAPVTTGNCATDQNYFLGLAHLHHLQVLHSDALVAEMTGHPHVLPNAARSGTIADGAIAAMRLRTVRRTLPIEVVLLHHALEALSFGATNHVNKISRLKLRDGEIHFAITEIGR